MTFLVFAGSILVLVGIHEAGHFFMARAFGVFIKEFAIGFGPKLFAVRGKETVYSLRLIPFGGYVRMAGEDRLEDDEDIPSHRVLYNKPPWARMLISLAGPFANLLLSFTIILIVVWSMAFPVLQVAGVVPDSPSIGVLEFGDRILTMNDQRILTRDQFTAVVDGSRGTPIAFTIERDGERVELSLAPDYVEDESRYVVGAYIFTAAWTNEFVNSDSASLLDAHGLRARDRITAVNGQETATYIEIQLATEAALPADSLTFSVDRSGERIDLIIPTTGRTLVSLFEGTVFADLGTEVRRAGLREGLAMAADQFVGYIRALADVIHSVFVGRVDAGDVFQGPVGVAQILGEGIRVSIAFFFQLLAFLSLNFGLINLVPFPALDGSRAAFALYEWIRGKPIPPQREGIIHAIGFAILIGLMILITYRDIARLFQ